VGPSGGEDALAAAAALGARLRERELAAAPAALNLLENRAPGRRGEIAALAAEVSPARLGREAPGHVVGVTGPPGAGKSTLLSALVRVWRASGRTVAVLAVDPSSKRSGGALLGDRARIDADPADRGLFVRSMAAGERLGGLAPATRAAAQALAAAFDVVVVETVGVGQSETEVAETADTVAVIVQPGSGDVLQFLKAGIMEVPDVLVVTKADLGAVADRAVGDLRAALGSLGDLAPVVAVSSVPPVAGIDALADALEAHRADLDVAATRTRARRLGALADFVAEHGERGLRALGGRRAAERFLADQDPVLEGPALVRALRGAVQRSTVTAGVPSIGMSAARSWDNLAVADMAGLRRDEIATPGTPAASPWQLRRGSWPATLKRTGKEFLDDHLLQWAAALTFFGVLALFPALLVLVSVLGLLGASAVQPLIENVSQLAPGTAQKITLDALQTIERTSGDAGLTFALGLGAALWSASAYVGAFIPAANVVWEVDEARPLLEKLLVRLALTVVMLVLVAMTALSVVLTGPIAQTVGGIVGLGEQAVTLWAYLKWPFLAAVMIVLLAILYWASPNIRHPGWRWVVPGSVVAVVLWIAASLGFTLYVTFFGSFNATYGSIGGVVVFLIWLWLTNIAILLGAELNAEIERTRAIEAGMRPADKTPFLPSRDATR